MILIVVRLGCLGVVVWQFVFCCLDWFDCDVLCLLLVCGCLFVSCLLVDLVWLGVCVVCWFV